MATVQVPPAVGTSGQFIDAVVITSSTLRQIIVLGDPATSGALSPVTSSAGMLTNVSNTIRSLSSGTITLSSNPTVVLSSPTSLSSGTVTLSSNPTVVLSSNPVASQIVSLSSGTVILTSNITVISASSGFVQALFPVMSSAGFGPVTSSAGVLASLSSGTITLSSQITVTATGPVSLSSTPLVNIVGTSSGIAIVTTSGGLNTNITNTLGPVSSSWGVTIVISTGAYGGVTSTYFVLTSIQPIKTSAGLLMGYSAYSSVDVTGGLVLRFYDMTTGSVTLGTSMKLVAPLPGLNSTGAVATVNPAAPVWFGPNGLAFGTAISVDAGVEATGAITASSIFLTAFYL